MSKDALSQENIELTLPVNAAYVSAARLTASSIANRMRFNIDEIEDIKVAISEACAYVIKKLPNDVNSSFKIEFHLNKGILDITLHTNSKIEKEDTEEEMSLLMIEALMDNFTIILGADHFTIKMTKNHKQNSFS